MLDRIWWLRCSAIFPLLLLVSATALARDPLDQAQATIEGDSPLSWYEISLLGL